MTKLTLKINSKDGVEFDPGYANNLIPFLPTIEQIEFELSAIKNFNQKKMKFKMLLPQAKRALNSTLGFWVGCILWAGVIKYGCNGAKILGNNFLNLTKDDLKEFEYAQEFDAIEGFINNYSKNIQYYLGVNEKLPENYLQIVKDYKEFLQINEHFINAETTTDIKIPSNYDYLKDCSQEEVLAKIEEIIALKDLSLFLK